MQILLTILLSFYPSLFLYSSVIGVFGKNLASIAASGFPYLLAHLLVFGVIFFVVHTILKKLISYGYYGATKRGFLGILIMTILTLAVAIIAFYEFLPGSILYPAPALIKTYLLANPYQLIALLLPFGYLFFD